MSLHVKFTLIAAYVPSTIFVAAIITGATKAGVTRKLYALEHGAPLILHRTHMAQRTASIHSGPRNRKLLFAEQKFTIVVLELQRRSGRHDRTLVDIAERFVMDGEQIARLDTNLALVALEVSQQNAQRVAQAAVGVCYLFEEILTEGNLVPRIWILV